jgi:O-antigen ligase
MADRAGVVTMSVAWQEKLGIWQSWLLVLVVFFLPIASTVSNILLFIFLLIWIVEGDFLSKFQKVRSHPLTYPMLAYAALYPLSLLWTENIVWGEYLVSRHLIFFIFPILITAIRKEHLFYYISAFVMAMTISELLSYSVWFGLIEVQGIHSYDPSGFSGLHNEYNNYLAFAVYLIGYSLLFENNSRFKIVFYLFFLATISINMFITGGRIGQIAYFAMIFLLFSQFFYSRGRLAVGLLSASFLSILILLVGYSQSQIFKDRFDLAVEQLTHHDESKSGSVNDRLNFWLNSIRMIPDRPFFGTGIGDFPEDYNRFVGDSAPAKMAPSSDVGVFHHPHNQYLYELVNFGIFGFVIFMWVFFSLIKEIFSLDMANKRLASAFTLLFLIIMLTDSYLLNVDFCLLFVLMVAILWTPNVKQEYQ